jgi:hypothetical protein
LAASPAEIQEAEAAKPADFPDPEYFAPGQSTESPLQSTESNASTQATNVDTPSQSDESEESQKAAPPAEGTSPNSPPPKVAATPIQESELNSFLAVGVPLAAAALLLGIYWVILRTGAV